MSVPFKGAHKIAALIAGAHLAGVLITAAYIGVASDPSGENALIWAFWVIVDIPVSLLAYELLDVSMFIAHAVLGTLWWYFLALVVVKLMTTLRVKLRRN